MQPSVPEPSIRNIGTAGMWSAMNRASLTSYSWNRPVEGPHVRSRSTTWSRTSGGLEPRTVGPPACRKSRYSLPSRSVRWHPDALVMTSGNGMLNARLCCTPPGMYWAASVVIAFEDWQCFSKWSSRYPCRASRRSARMGWEISASRSAITRGTSGYWLIAKPSATGSSWGDTPIQPPAGRDPTPCPGILPRPTSDVRARGRGRLRRPRGSRTARPTYHGSARAALVEAHVPPGAG